MPDTASKNVTNSKLDKTNENNENKENQEKKDRNGWPIVLLGFVIVFFLISCILLGSHLYKMATLDRYAVNLVTDSVKKLELFKIEYSNTTQEITVSSMNGENIVAPGTNVDYEIRLKNEDEVYIDYLLAPSQEFHTSDVVPIEIRLQDANGNYLLGDENTWVPVSTLNDFTHKGTLRPSEITNYYFSWRWEFERGEDEEDTNLGIYGETDVPGLTITFQIDSTTNTKLTGADSVTHSGGYGCCFCCYLVWILLLVIILLLIYIWKLKDKVSELEDDLMEIGALMEETTEETEINEA